MPAASPSTRAPPHDAAPTHTQLQSLSRQLRRAEAELASTQEQLACTAKDLSAACLERDRCLRALEEAHGCVSEYHKKLGRMEQTVGHALVSRGEVKDLHERVAELTKLTGEYRGMLSAAEDRLEDLRVAEGAAAARAAGAATELGHERAQAVELRAAAARGAQAAAALEECRAEAGEACARAERAEQGERAAQGKQQEALAALADLVELQRQCDGERAAARQAERAAEARAAALQARALLLFFFAAAGARKGCPRFRAHALLTQRSA